MAIASGITLTNMYSSIVDVPAWSAGLPHSIATAREYFRVSNPGDFFRVFSPLNQALGLIALLAFWKRGGKIRLLLASAFLLYVIGEGMTFMYFYPRNEILFTSDITRIETLRQTLNEWSSMNWLRTAVVACGVACSAMALHYTYVTQAASSIYRSKNKPEKNIVMA